MTTDSLKGLVELAANLTGMNVDRARELTKSLLSAALSAVDEPSQAVAKLSDVLRSGAAQTPATDSELAGADLSDVVRAEVDRAAARLGFVREEELAALRARIQRLEASLAAGSAAAPSPVHKAATDDSASSGSSPRRTTASSGPRTTAASSRSAGTQQKAQPKTSTTATRKKSA